MLSRFDPNREARKLAELLNLHSSWSEQDIQLSYFYLNSGVRVFAQQGYPLGWRYTLSVKWRLVARTFARQITGHLLGRVLRVGVCALFASLMPNWATLAFVFFLFAYELVLREEQKSLTIAIAMRRTLRSLALALSLWLVFIFAIELLRILFPGIPSTFVINHALGEVLDLFQSMLSL